MPFIIFYCSLFSYYIAVVWEKNLYIIRRSLIFMLKKYGTIHSLPPNDVMTVLLKSKNKPPRDNNLKNITNHQQFYSLAMGIL